MLKATSTIVLLLINWEAVYLSEKLLLDTVDFKTLHNPNFTIEVPVETWMLLDSITGNSA
jgi:hypothetical protein